MTDTTQTPTTTEGDARAVALISYGLFFLALANGITAVIGVVLAYVKRGDTRGTIWESHFTNLIRVFWITLAIIVLFTAIVLFGVVDLLAAFDSTPKEWVLLVPVLFALGIGSTVWYLYRTVRGFTRALDNQPY
jgi:uncharacterized membrane protein